MGGCTAFCLCLRRIPYVSVLAGCILTAASVILGIEIQNVVDIFRNKFNMPNTSKLTLDEENIFKCIENGTIYLIIVTAVIGAIGMIVAFLETGPTRLQYCMCKWIRCCGLFWTDVLMTATLFLFALWTALGGVATYYATSVFMLSEYCEENNNMIGVDLNVYGPVLGYAQDGNSTVDTELLCKSADDLADNGLIRTLGAVSAIILAQVLFFASHVANHTYLRLMTPTETLDGMDGTAMSKV